VTLLAELATTYSEIKTFVELLDRQARQIDANLAASKLQHPSPSLILSLPKKCPIDEESVVETLRRLSELVVYGDQNDDDLLSSSGSPDPSLDEPTQGLFEFFCEKNCLMLLVDVVTGRALSNTEPSSQLYLPPVSVSLQTIQTISIIILNVKRPTSLYYLLSNNYINELIDFPLTKYQTASLQPAPSSSTSTTTPSSPFSRLPEAFVSELTTQFVTFLKSLSGRMDADTVGFFLTYPASTSDVKYHTHDTSIPPDSVKFPL
jgi:hypothetical protein